MRKLTFQWSLPTFLVLKVAGNACSVRPLVSAPGRAGQYPKDAVMNLNKVKYHSSPPSGFWIGCWVLREFKRKWYLGSLDDVSVDDGQKYFHVTFDDSDEQELDKGEVWDHVIYHPELEVNERRRIISPRVSKYRDDGAVCCELPTVFGQSD